MNQNDQILYFFDPLCGWCYGFSKTMLEFYEQHKDKFTFQAIPGGMITGSRVAPYRNMEQYIRGARTRLEEVTGSRLSESYIENVVSSNILMNSEPPCRALVAFRTFKPKETLPFAHALKQKHFMSGCDYNDVTLYGELAEEFGVAKDHFFERFHEDQLKSETHQEFARVNHIGVRGFPTVLLKSAEQYFMITNGFSTLDTLNDVLKKVQNTVAV